MKETFKYTSTPTSTIIFGVSGLIGSGASFVANSLEEELQSFGYKVTNIKVAQKFLENKFLSDNTEIDIATEDKELLRKILSFDGNKDINSTSPPERIKKLQDTGNSLRKKYGNAVLSEISAYYLAKHIIQNTGERRAYIIDSLKNFEEVNFLRSIFKESFFMIGVVADDNIRKRRLQDQKQVYDTDFNAISKNENTKDGIQIKKTILESDYFFENNYDKPDKINSECRRLLDLIFQSSIITPRQDEHGMHLAFVEARKSACLSRQVGAAIISKEGNILSLGHNDVPKFGGGLYNSESINDRRCFANSRVCHNDLEKIKILDEIIDKIKECSCVSDEDIKEIKNKISETRLGNLTEFSRAVHAEMDAIIALSRSAISGIVGSTMYVTTYPCHNCAKHIIDAGIKRVVFLEPYEKSLALQLHFDAINDPFEECKDHKVSFDNYGGVSPRRYNEIFAINSNKERKDKDSKKLKYYKREDSSLFSICDSESIKNTLCRFMKDFKKKFDSCDH
jgi:deoxycytidylate deaminase